MFPESEIILLHGGDSDVLLDLQGGGDLYGYVDENNPQFSGNLTDNDFIASQFALHPGKPRDPDASPIIFKFKLPSHQVRKLGRVPGYNGGNGYATMLTVPPDEVPDKYLERAGFGRLSADEFAHVGIIFYRVPSPSLVGFEKLY